MSSLQSGEGVIRPGSIVLNVEKATTSNSMPKGKKGKKKKKKKKPSTKGPRVGPRTLRLANLRERAKGRRMARI